MSLRILWGTGSESQPLAHRLPSWVSLTSKQKAGTEHRVGWPGTQRKPQIQEEVELGGKHLHVLKAKYFYMLTDNWTVGTPMTCSCTKRNLHPKEGNWFIQGHTASTNMHWAACSVPGERTGLVSSASPAPFLLTASPVSTS